MAELSHQSFVTWAVRQYLPVVVARKVSESVFASAVLSQLRERKWEIDELATELCRRNPSLLPKGSNVSADEAKAAKVQAFAKYVIDSVREFHVVPTDAEDAQTTQSQAQLIADLQASGLVWPGPGGPVPGGPVTRPVRPRPRPSPPLIWFWWPCPVPPVPVPVHVCSAGLTQDCVSCS